MESPADRTLQRYLLGDLPAAEIERLDERSVVDAAFADRLRALEHDLADAYARGELSQADQQKWDRTFGASAAGRSQLRLAQALAAREARATGRARLEQPRPNRLRMLAVAAGITLAVIAGYSVHRDAPAPATIGSSASSVVAVTLPAPTRGSDMRALSVPRGTTDVEVSLRLASDESLRYIVEVHELSSNRIVWKSGELSAVSRGTERVVVCTLPASALQSGRFAFELHAAAAPQSDVLASYLLRIDR